jgi:hypothetical protein
MLAPSLDLKTQIIKQQEKARPAVVPQPKQLTVQELITNFDSLSEEEQMEMLNSLGIPKREKFQTKIARFVPKKVQNVYSKIKEKLNRSQTLNLKGVTNKLQK